MIRYLLIAMVIGSSCTFAWAEAEQDTPHATVKVKLDGVDEKVHVIRQPDGTHRFVLNAGGELKVLRPEAFADRVFSEQTRRTSLQKVLNITSPIGMAWVAIGLLGQVLFTGRMIVQWLTSERKKRSVVPTAFWWMSLGGASMLIVYFLWRKDIIGVLGQCTGWFIYIRNLWLIYRKPQESQAEITDDPGPEPQIET